MYFPCYRYSVSRFRFPHFLFWPAVSSFSKKQKPFDHRRWLHEALGSLMHDGEPLYDVQLFACSECLSKPDKINTAKNAVRQAFC